MKTFKQHLIELSKKTLGRYINKAADDVHDAGWAQGHTTTKYYKDKAATRADKRKAGIAKATDRLTKEETLDELSKKTLNSYKTKAWNDSAKIGEDEATRKRKSANRMKGYVRAKNRTDEETAVDEAKKSRMYNDGTDSDGGIWGDKTFKVMREKPLTPKKKEKPFRDAAVTGKARDFKNEEKVYDPFSKKMVLKKPIKSQAGGTATRDGKPVEVGPSKKWKQTVGEEVLDEVVNLRKKYDKNEDENRHSENAVLLAKHFGTPDEHERAKDLLKQRNKLGHAPHESGDFQYQMSKKYYHKLGEEVISEEHEMKYGHELHPDDQKHVLSAYVHRFTGEHKPQWAHKPRSDSSKYMPQHKDDSDWLHHTQFAVKKNGRLNHAVKQCHSTPTWPQGMHEEVISEEHEMSDAAHELVLHADNESHLYHGSHLPIMNNLKKKMKAGKYDPEKAKKLWGYHADRAAQSYHKQYGEKSQPWHKMFTTADRHQAASHWEAHHRDELNESVQINEVSKKSDGHKRPDRLARNNAAVARTEKQGHKSNWQGLWTKKKNKNA